MKLFRLKTGNKNNPSRSRAGETLVEVIMAIFVVATGSAAATSLIVTSLQSNSFSRDNLIALNLAVEGIEAMRNIRDSNWLKFGYDKENCWNMRPEESACADLDLIRAGSYTVDLDVGTMKWLLSDPKSAPNILDLGGGITPDDDFYRLTFLDLDGVGGDHDLYVSGTLTPTAPAATNDDSIFYRMVTIDYDGVAAEIADEMTVTSLVQWKAQNAVHEVNLTTKLSNYQKVRTS